VAAAIALSYRLPDSAITSAVTTIEPSAKIKIATPANGYDARTKNAHSHVDLRPVSRRPELHDCRQPYEDKRDDDESRQ